VFNTCLPALTSTDEQYSCLKRSFCKDLMKGNLNFQVFQRRDGSIPDFHNKKWEEYAKGFGNLEKEYWMGKSSLYH